MRIAHGVWSHGCKNPHHNINKTESVLSLFANPFLRSSSLASTTWVATSTTANRRIPDLWSETFGRATIATTATTTGMDLAESSKRIHEQLNSDPFALDSVVPKRGKGQIDDSEDAKKLARDGFVILESVLSKSELAAVREVLEKILSETPQGRNNFEGTKTQRIYALLGKSRVFDGIAMHPRVMDLLDRFLSPNPLITAYQAINILPGETPQPFHHDDQFVTIPRPHPPFSVATVWAIDDFTAENGGTVVIPGSHTWGENRLPTPQDPQMPVVMPAGSVVVFLSTLWHGGGANRSSGRRLAVSAQYCEPYIRPQENQFLIVPPEVVPTLHPKLQSLIGYSIHPPFIGHVNGIHPLKAIPTLWTLDGSKRGPKAAL